ncbi:MAG TPA: aminotransferase class III-fold pyridoxal phosphate-dependent enzyme [Thermotogota bacterium]|nr:aminotransferase class III-fold pyridoxal phosphate-dependent enzyme [Thermotogota bacterium]
MFRMNLYKEFDFKVEKAQGVTLFDTKGNRYMDTFSGIGVLALGHSHPDVLKAQQLQMNRYEHISNFFIQDDAEDIAKVLVEKTGRTGQVFFTNSGTEAVEAALKAVKKKSQQTGKQKVLTFSNAFHGRTLGSLSLTGFERMRKPFEPLLENIIRIPFNDVDKFRQAVDDHLEETVALFLEPVQGAGGVVKLDQAIADIITNTMGKGDVLLICDEVQAGLGRTGTFYAYQHLNLNPDIITLGKAIGGGLPLGATVFLNGTETIFQQGDHGSTFAPNPVSLAGGKVVVQEISQILDDVEKKGVYFVSRIKAHAAIQQIRQTGLMIGITLTDPQPCLREKAQKMGLLINVLNDRIIRLLPALNVEYSEIDEMAKLLNQLLDD